MNNLINISGTQVSLSPSGLRVLREVSINDYPLQVVEYKGERVVSSYDIAHLHNKPVKAVNQQFERNKNRLKEGVDYFLIGKEEFSESLSVAQTFIPNNVKDIKLFTERGYLKLVKSFTDDLSWQVQDLLVDSYFKLKEALSSKYTYQLGIINAPTETDRMIALNNYEIGYVQPLEDKVEELTPKADVYDAIIESKNTFSMANTAQIINIEKMGRNKLLAWLRSEKVLKNDNTPYRVKKLCFERRRLSEGEAIIQKYINKGWFEVKLTPTVNGVKPCSRTTPKGIEGILKMFE